mmetsp:Transcript_4745/g.11194  ORF Transcript_4745/g.11194 Transcript_4745/m.11194 type:complete len:310 (+) Transcript_4745:258-1187(+)|eukprot:CAMPEP_0113654290 /NCGR_PEP_ID=MMETSP0017_2-20120614/29077_1 /TAXON_ID=2856 /ORGANISM="Cylindrotheca closterium" /LENGTH=309 /DNA_ID=CAMNT_0000567427 /DNA_START=131 /DNA_END=1060 /DNA_ORIENTATION=- /assembly_acc=CAM_ASM_000147
MGHQDRSVQLKTRATVHHPNNTATSDRSRNGEERGSSAAIFLGSSPAAVGLKRNNSERDGNVKTSVSSTNAILYSWMAGTLRGVGNALLLSTAPVDVVQKTVRQALDAQPPMVTTMPSIMRMMVPGFFSFQTHHVVSHNLWHLVPASKDSTFWERVWNHQLHFVAGAAGGLAYGLAASAVEQALTMRSMKGHAVGHGALFGGYDCYSDLFFDALQLDKNTTEVEEKDGLMIPSGMRRPLAVSVSGGFAGMTQALIKDVMSSSSSQGSYVKVMMKQSPARLLRAFPPGAAAFSAYEYTRSFISGGVHQQE